MLGKTYFDFGGKVLKKVGYDLTQFYNGGVKMKRTFSLGLLSSCLLLGLFLFHQNSLLASELKIASYNPPAHPAHAVLTKWAKTVEERTRGAVKFTIFAPGVLCHPLEIYEAVVKNVAEAGFMTIHVEEKFPLTVGINQSMIGFPSASAATEIWRELFKKYPEVRNEYKDLHIMGFSTMAGFDVLTKKPVRGLRDFLGLRLRSSPAYVSLLKQLGAAPVSMSLEDSYVALQKGIIDGIFTSSEVLKAWKFAEVVKYVTILNLTSGIFIFGMNVKSWEALPPDARKIIDELSYDLTNELTKANDDLRNDALDFAKKKGNEILNLSRASLEEIYGKIRPLNDGWAERMEKKGLPGKAILNDVRTMLKKYQ